MSQETKKKKSLAPEQNFRRQEKSNIWKKDHTSLSSLFPATQFYSGHHMQDLETDAKKF